MGGFLFFTCQVAGWRKQERSGSNALSFTETVVDSAVWAAVIITPIEEWCCY